MPKIDIDPLELASLVASRVCHDIISPVGAIANGLEVLEEEEDEGMRDFAMDLVKKSTGQASVKLQFARLAFGASGGAGSEIDMADAGECAKELIEREKTSLDWQVSSPMLPKTEAKLLLNLVLLGMQSIARGGALTVSADQNGGQCVMRLVAVGDRAKFPASAKSIITTGAMPQPMDAHAVQPVYVALLAEQAGMTISVQEEEGSVIIGARSAASFPREQSNAAASGHEQLKKVASFAKSD